MRHKLFAAAILTAALASAGTAGAAEVVFRFASVVGGNGTSIAGTTQGAPLTITVIADNGTARLASNDWNPKHHMFTEVRVGDSWSLTQNGSLQFWASTDDAGRVTAIDILKSPGLAVGSGGAGGGMALTVNGARNIVIDGHDALDAEALTEPENWTVELR